MTFRYVQIVNLEKEAAGIKYIILFDNNNDILKNSYIHNPFICANNVLVKTWKNKIQGTEKGHARKKMK